MIELLILLALGFIVLCIVVFVGVFLGMVFYTAYKQHNKWKEK